MVVAGGDYVHFVVEYGGKIEKCRVTETAAAIYLQHKLRHEYNLLTG